MDTTTVAKKVVGVFIMALSLRRFIELTALIGRCFSIILSTLFFIGKTNSAFADRK
jgi:hypothetical protein